MLRMPLAILHAISQISLVASLFCSAILVAANDFQAPVFLKTVAVSAIIGLANLGKLLTNDMTLLVQKALASHTYYYMVL